MIMDVCIKFSLAVVLAGALGLERERQGRAAGLRTHIMVCLGTVLAVVAGQQIALQWANSESRVVFDQGRIAAGVLTGIGFLGAGAIINIGSIRRGLTTASTIWFVAALGIAIGLGFYAIALCATLFAFVVVVGLRYASYALRSHETMTLEVHLRGSVGDVETIERSLAQSGCNVTASRLQAFREENRVIATFEVVAGAHPDLEEMATSLQGQFPTIQSISFERWRVHE